MKKNSLPFLLLFLAGLASGCVFPGHHHSVGIRFPVGHRHSHSCGHYRSGGSWHVSRGHNHGHGCGHVYVGGVWKKHH